MKKSQLKKILKPIVKECIKESLLEDGILSGVISEVFKGMSPVAQPVKAQSARDTTLIESLQKETNQGRQQKLEEQKQKMLDAIGIGSYNNVDLFEGTTPLTRGGAAGAPSPRGALADVAPGDAGVDISGLLGGARNWNRLIK